MADKQIGWCIVGPCLTNPDELLGHACACLSVRIPALVPAIGSRALAILCLPSWLLIKLLETTMPRKKQRSGAWKSDSDCGTVEALKTAIADACPTLFMIGNLYPSENMKSGIDVKALCNWSKVLLAPLLALDPRGGFFSQLDVYEAVVENSASSEMNKFHAENSALQQKRSIAGFFVIDHGSLLCHLHVVGQCLTLLNSVVLRSVVGLCLTCPIAVFVSIRLRYHMHGS